MIFGRTELIIGESGAENRQDSVGKVRFLVAPQKSAKNPKIFVKIFEKIRDRGANFWETALILAGSRDGATLRCCSTLPGKCCKPS